MEVKKYKINMKNKKQEKNYRNITIILIITFNMSLLFSSYSMAKILGDLTNVKAQAQIAEPILEVEESPSIDITEVNNSGTYAFKIKNFNEQDKLTEVGLKYYIEVISNTDNTVDIELFEGNKQIELKNNKTDYIKISNSKMETKEYKVKITYAKDNSKSMKDILEKVHIKVHTEQEKS